MVRLLVNNVEQVQPDNRDDTIIKLFARSAGNSADRVEVSVFGFDPYFYALEEEVERNEDFLLSQESVQRIEYGGHGSLSGDDLAKIYPPYPQDTRTARQLVDKTWAADVPFTNRFRIDTEIRDIIEIPDSCEETGVYECHWREIEPVVPPSSEDNPQGQRAENGGA